MGFELSVLLCQLGGFYLKICHLLSDLAQLSACPQESYPEFIRLFTTIESLVQSNQAKITSQVPLRRYPRTDSNPAHLWTASIFHYEPRIPLQ